MGEQSLSQGLLCWLTPLDEQVLVEAVQAVKPSEKFFVNELILVCAVAEQE